MAHFLDNQRNYSQKELEEEEIEKAEEIEVNGYNSNDLFLTNFNFVVPGNRMKSKKSHKFKYKTKTQIPSHSYYRRKKQIGIPICTCKFPNSNMENNYRDNKIETNQIYSEFCPYCKYENELMDENPSFLTEVSKTLNDINEMRNNEFMCQNNNRSMRNIKNKNETEKYILNTLPSLQRRQIPYNNQEIYYMPYSKNNLITSNKPIYNYADINPNFKESTPNNVYFFDRNVIKLNKDNEFIHMNQFDMNNKNLQNNNMFMVEQKTNNFIIDNEDNIINQISLRNKNKINKNDTNNNIKDIDKNKLILYKKEKNKKSSIPKNKNKIDKKKEEDNINSEDYKIERNNSDENQKINYTKETKETNLNYQEENINLDSSKNVVLNNDEDNIIQNKENNIKMLNNKKNEQNKIIDYKQNEQTQENCNENEIIGTKDKTINNLNQKEENNNEVNYTNNDQNIKLKEIDNNHNEEFKVDNINLGNDINEKNDEKKNKITREDNNKKEKMEINNNNVENTNNDINKEEIDNIYEMHGNEFNNGKNEMVGDDLIEQNKDNLEENEKQNEMINISNDLVDENKNYNNNENEENININDGKKHIYEIREIYINNYMKNKGLNINNENNQQNIDQNLYAYNEKIKENEIIINQTDNKEENNENQDQYMNYYESTNNPRKENNDLEINNNINKNNEKNIETNLSIKQNLEIILNNNNTNTNSEKNYMEEIKEDDDEDSNLSIKQNLENKINSNKNIFEGNNNNQEIKEKNDIYSLNEKSVSRNKDIGNAKKIDIENRYKKPQSNDLLFNPKISKKKKIEPLFNKYEQLQGQEKHYYSKTNIQSNETSFKKAIEIFPSQYGIEMPYKSQLRHSDYNLNNNSSNKKMDKIGINKTTSGKKRNKDKYNSNTKIKSELYKEKTYSQKNHRLYENNLKSSNPFVGLSHYDKNTKERKNLIAKTIQKEGDEYNYINLFEENISKKKDLNDDDLNKFIIALSSYLFDIKEKNLENKDAYEFKINKITNIIKNMKGEEQKKILNNLKQNAKDDYSSELFEKIKNKIDDFKDKILKVYKNPETSEE